MWYFMRPFHNFMKNPDFSAKSGPNPDQFAQKSPDPDQSPEIRTKVGALQMVVRNNLPAMLMQCWSQRAFQEHQFRSDNNGDIQTPYIRAAPLLEQDLKLLLQTIYGCGCLKVTVLWTKIARILQSKINLFIKNIQLYINIWMTLTSNPCCQPFL